ncbi:lanthionine synthetase C family protein [Streptomyces sp. NPDC050610]|uniref:lanthionine synthetase C family protein n=1 Tax=Streptomyces sp. NPDC050610 TaxID=3157097 RepID=UPI003444A13E
MTSVSTVEMPSGGSELRARAAEVAAELASRLADPERTASAVSTASATSTASAASASSTSSAASAWSPLSLDGGHPGVALLFAELAHHDPALRASAHAHLAAAAAHLPGPAATALYHGVPALAFAAHTARRTPQGYGGLFERLDPVLDRALRRALKGERDRLEQGRAGVPCSRYDLANGVTGLTRLLLSRRAEHHDTLAEALSYLVRLARPLPVNGEPAPGWWSPSGPSGDPTPDPAYPRGHVNFGLAHGISGPLAVLSAALRAGVHVPGARRAVAALARELLAHRTGEGGWPALMPLERYGAAPPPPARTAWCYGTPGTAVALFRAGQALDRADLRRTAVEALAADLDHPRRVTDNALCHGRAGLLHICRVMAAESGSARLAARGDALAARLLADYDARRPYGYRFENGVENRVGLLTGAAGIALSLHAYATDARPASGWDAALLVS